MRNIYLLNEIGSDGISGVISGLSFSQPSKKPKLATSDFQEKRKSQIFGKQAAIKNKFNAMRRKRIIEALAMGERDPTQRRVRSGQDNTPSTEVGVKGSQSVPTRDLNDESGNNNKKNVKIVPSIENNQESGKNKKNENNKNNEKSKLKENSIDEGILSNIIKYMNKLFHRKSEEPEKPKENSKDYIWRTQEDEKVRDLHRDLEGKTFNRDNPPVSGTSGFRGNPGEPANCRCYAEPVEENNINNITRVIEHLNNEGTKSCLFKQKTTVFL